MRPHLFVAAPGEPMWQWPASFMDVNLARLRELDHVDADFVTEVRGALAAAAANPRARMFTPTVLEIIATKA